MSANTLPRSSSC